MSVEPNNECLVVDVFSYHQNNILCIKISFLYIMCHGATLRSYITEGKNLKFSKLCQISYGS